MIEIKKPRLMLLLSIMTLSACGKPTTLRYYLLEPEQIEVTKKIEQNPVNVIGLGPISFPDYLKRTQLVVRKNQVELNVLDQHRWAEPLEENFVRVLASELSSLQASSRLVPYPSRYWSQVQQQLLVDIRRFDSDIDGRVVLEAEFSLLEGGQGNRQLVRNSTLVMRNHSANDYTSMVRVMSQLVQKLAGQLQQLLLEARAN